MVLTPLPKDLLIYHSAKQFSVGAGAIEKFTRIPDSTMFAVQPFIVCAAFSVELYLKCLLEISGKSNVKGHDLLKLFSQLPTKDKEGILFFIRGAYVNLSLPLTFLEERLAELGEAFVEWRYVHEDKILSIDVHFLRQFAWGCREHIHNLRPDWPNLPLNSDPIAAR
ncbi:hypothetical protein [Geothrix sp.]|jgi:hypothetical protein|uniref:hypothetical protein n=1 Tax=Geothrix sp. TaxID=1962974 RepID=UPI0025C1661A|nr:hypothetical protein [Geothrix sp.]